MKKLFLFSMTLLFSMVLGFTSCNSCKSDKVEPVASDSLATDNADANGVLSVINVENLISMDRQEMYFKFKDNYRWYETGILLPEFLDSEDVTSDPLMVVNVFQGIVEKGNGYDTWVYKFQHFANGTVVKDSVQDAFEKILEVNAPKPHSKNCVLRNPIGPVACNAQYVFGNIKEQLWVDAKTGDVKNSNPAFPKEKGFKMPLGEWP